ncbi:MAG TPA: hypothetical protein VIW92_02485 [Thermoanaerobaculia bacterium]
MKLEITGSVLEHLERRGVYLVVRLRVSGVQAELLFFHGEAHGTVESLPIELAAGTVEGTEGSFEGSVPVPFPYPGTVQLHLQGVGGENVVIVGQSLAIQMGGPERLVPLGRPRP